MSLEISQKPKWKLLELAGAVKLAFGRQLKDAVQYVDNASFVKMRCAVIKKHIHTRLESSLWGLCTSLYAAGTGLIPGTTCPQQASPGEILEHRAKSTPSIVGMVQLPSSSSTEPQNIYTCRLETINSEYRNIKPGFQNVQS